MKLFTRPYWLWLSVVLPQTLIALYYFSLYGLIGTLLQPEHLRYWMLGGGLLGASIVGSAAQALWLQRRGRAISWRHALFTLAVCTVLLVLYIDNIDKLLPASIPRWMVSSDEAFLLPFGLMMPALMHALVLLVEHLTPASGTKPLLQTTAGVIAVPAFWYLALRFGPPMLQGKIDGPLFWHLLEIAFILLGVAFMFLLLRLCYLLLLRLPPPSLRRAWLVRLPFVLLLPLLSLTIYNGALDFLGVDVLTGAHRILGDWSHPGYYALVIANGVLLMLPAPRARMLGLSIFGAKALLFPFVLYFFIVFLPFFPFAVSAVVVFGLGFLLLTPLILFFFHCGSLHADWRQLRGQFGPVTPALTLLAAMAVMPLALTVSFAMDRATLNAMLTQVDEPDYASPVMPVLDAPSARRVLEHIKSLKEGADFFAGKRKPYLTSYYQWLVLDNLTLSDNRLDQLARIFLDEAAWIKPPRATARAAGPAPKVTGVSTHTEPATDGRYYRSRIDLEITNHAVMGAAEFATRFRLPPGAWITNYDLVIDGTKVPGILAERKSALWIYQQIRSEQRDPGILYYTSADELILRVFPFAAGQTRQTGFDLIHREPLAFTLDGRRIELKLRQSLAAASTTDNVNDNFVLVPATEKSRLPRIRRTPYLHFIIDRSAHAASRFDDFRLRVDELLKQPRLLGIATQGAQITLANHASLTVPADADWPTHARQLAPDGGFHLEQAVKRALYHHYRQATERYPVFVVVSDDLDQAILTDGLHDFSLAMPEGDLFLVLGERQTLDARHFEHPTQALPLKDLFPTSRPVLGWPAHAQPVAYLPDDGRASLVIKRLEPTVVASGVQRSAWEQGLQLHGQWLLTRLNPRAAARQRLDIVAQSFRSHLLTPLTAFLAPENEAQRQMLARKQQQILSARHALDIGEEHMMDEPPLWLLALFLLALLPWTRRRGHRAPHAASVVRSSNSPT